MGSLILQQRLAIKTRIGVSLIIVFIVLSLVFFLSHNNGTSALVRSSELKKIITTNRDTVRTEYVDEQGKVTFAADVGYAIMTVTNTENGKLEEYFDADANPIPFKSNTYYAILREYDEQENNIKNTYLDANGEPVTVNYGYASVIRSFSDKGKALTEKFYDINGNPVCTTVFGYGKLNEYDEQGRVIRQTYIDENGDPMVSGQGYATAEYHYYSTNDINNGRVESELYYDTEGNPVALSLGQYGVHKGYNEYGLNSILTYLDMEGNPIITTKGYTTIVRTYYANNAVETERYYDAEGNPISLSEGQYGVLHQGGKDSYLDAEGNKQFNLKLLLFNQKYLVGVAAIVVVSISMLAGRKMNILLLSLYGFFIIYMTLMFRGNGEPQVNMKPLWAYRQIISSFDARSDVFNNIWLFIPFGAILYKLYPKRVVLFVPLAISILIEVTQYVRGTGLCELDDVISNVLGSVIGFGAGKLLQDTKAKTKWKCKSLT